MFKRIIPVLLIVFVVFFSSSALAYYHVPKPKSYVLDQAGVLSSQDEEALSEKLNAIQKNTSDEIALVFLDSLRGDTIEHFAVKLFKDWGIGEKGKDNGVLLLVAVKEHQVRIEVGYGLEGALTDLQSKEIITNIITPHFKQGQYYQGANLAIGAINSAIRGEYQADIARSTKQAHHDYSVLILFAFYLLLSIKVYLAKTKSWWQGGILGLVVGLIIAFFVLHAFYIITIIISIIIGLLFDLLVSRVPVFGNHKNGRNNWWFFGGGRGGGRGGGFGGFGGGFSGGGGSSGSW